MNSVIQVLTGFLMACADSVPGVSGGSICYILGQYDRLFTALKDLKNIKSPSFRGELKFLLRIFGGWITGFVFSILIIAKIVDVAIYQLSSLFVGFIFVAIVITFINEKNIILSNKKDFIFGVVGFLAVVLVTFFGEFVSFNITNMNPLVMVIYLYITGAIAVSAMLLPGISGSTMLVIFGSYYFIIDGLEKFFNFDFSVFGFLFVFGLGVLSGGFFAVKVISYHIKHNYSKLLYLIEGLMLGSFYPIIVGPSTIVDDNGNLIGNSNLNFDNFSFLMFGFGVVFLIILNYFGDKKKVDS